jgi:diadenosine tetraphosphate (Ap4A) HIT family hydrolase
MKLSIPERISMAHAGTNSTIICAVPSGWAAMCDMQFLPGYIIQLADPPVASINELDLEHRRLFLIDMVLIGDALMEVTGAYRINYAIAGNSDPYLHTHIIPRYMTEPDQYRMGLPWSYPKEQMDANLFDPERDRDLISRLQEAIQKRL